MVTNLYINQWLGYGDNQVILLTSLVNSKNIVLNHGTSGKLLKLDPKAIVMSQVDVSNSFKFNSDELKLFITIFCGVESPQMDYQTDKGISYEHYTPFYQILDEIIKINMLSSQN